MDQQSFQEILTAILEFLSTIAHWLGGKIVTLIAMILPSVSLGVLPDPIGYLAILTILLIVATVAKKVAWIIVAVGGGLILIRIALIAVHASR